MWEEQLSSPADYDHQFPVHYAYDYLDGGVADLKLPFLRLNDYISSRQFLRMGKDLPNYSKSRERGYHAIDISPSKAGISWASGILFCRQNKHWQLTLDTTRMFLALFAVDDSTPRMIKSGYSIAEIPCRELSSNMEEGWVKFPVYRSSCLRRLIRSGLVC